MFVAAPTKAMLKAYVADMRARAARAGRDPRKLIIYTLVTVIVDETDAKAQAKFEDFKSYSSYDGSLVFMSGWSGIDFGQYAPTDLVKHVETNAVQSLVEHLAGGDKSWTIDELAKFGGIGGVGPVFVGSPSTIADILQEWVEETDVDGFNLAYAITPGTFEDIVGYRRARVAAPRRLSDAPTGRARCAKSCLAKGPICRRRIPAARYPRHRSGEAPRSRGARVGRRKRAGRGA